MGQSLVLDAVQDEALSDNGQKAKKMIQSIYQVYKTTGLYIV